ncbi:MAG: hypothetical protein NVS1B4_01450 [Gemmatimonadaceae bacterium]
MPGRLDLLVHISPSRPAIGAGLRAATATVVPLLAGYAFHLPGMDWASLAGFSASLADKGGAYQSRAVAMSSFAIAGAVSVLLAAVAGLHPSAAVPLMFLWAAGGSLAQVYGSTGASVGPSVALVFLASLAAPAQIGPALERAAYFGAGGLWAMLLALVLWPLRPYRPARLAVAGVFRALADYAVDIGREAPEVSRVARRALAGNDHAHIRETIEGARGALVAMRKGRQAESGRGERLLVILEAADLLFPTLVAIDDVLDAAATDASAAASRTAAKRAVSAFVGTARDIALLVETEGRSLIALPIVWGSADVRAALAADPSPTGGAPYAYAAELLARLVEYAGVACDAASSLEDESTPATATRTPSVDSEPAQSWLAPLRENMTFRSAELRHAVRVGLVAGVTVWVTRALALAHGTWVTTTAIVILQPQAGLTLVRGAQRVVGTVVGGVLTAAIGVVVHDPLGILVFAFVLSALCVAVLPLNYTAYSIFLTPAFVLLAEASAGDWHLGWVRIVNTVIGGALAFVGSRLLWPTTERERFPEQLAAALRADGDYLRRALSGGHDDESLGEARRTLGLAAIDAESSFQRLLAEWRGGPSRLEPVMTLLTYTRRLAAAVTALAPPRSPHVAVPRREGLAPLARAAATALDEMADTLTLKRSPTTLADLDTAAAAAAARAPDDSLFRAQLDRVVRHVVILHGAVTRLHFAASNDRRGPGESRRGAARP